MKFLVFLIGILAVKVFVESFKEARKEFGPELKEWFKGTKLGMWYTNKKNGVTVLSDRQYRKLLKSGEIKSIEIEVE
jgi:hypothetical protein